MRVKRGSFSAHYLTAVLASTAVMVVLATPVSVEAQCAYCKETSENVWECGAPTGSLEDRCEGGTGSECFGCPWFASLASDLSPDGSLLGAGSATPGAVAFAAEELLPGVSVLRSTCNRAITDRLYTEEAAQRARQETRTLAFQ
jgi:hypothetical protein